MELPRRLRAAAMEARGGFISLLWLGCAADDTAEDTLQVTLPFAAAAGAVLLPHPRPWPVCPESSGLAVFGWSTAQTLPALLVQQHLGCVCVCRLCSDSVPPSLHPASVDTTARHEVWDCG